MERRRDEANAGRQVLTECFKPGVKVWLYVNQVRPGFAKKLAHLWHGPFRVLERISPYVVRLETDKTTYKFFPVVHTSRLKLWKSFVGRPDETLVNPQSTRFDFDEAMLPEDSFERPLGDDEYEGRPLREYLVKWTGYDEPTWVSEADLTAPALLDDYERARGRFEVMDTDQQ
ncbi:hypothetical protein P43SY_010221 [Pythium insidiosum]|uniref:Chromo domain-containing protein n=1 Tax=Pythium insidiosum TaxID=114742 RepID=A0AAD5Q558_PYTIN|nr:hypothetical protein P43SY_010221 [Pythium insidiosum]